jgi:voltage-gated potassium channel
MRRTVILAAAAMGCVLAGAVAFAVTDHVSFWLACYFSLTTTTTVGYGDVLPRTPSAHVVALALMVTALPLTGATFASLTALHVHRHVKAHVDRALAAHPPQDDEGEVP